MSTYDDNDHTYKESTPFIQVRDAVYDAIVKKNFVAIEKVVDNNLNDLVQVSETKTPIFAAVEKMLTDKGMTDASEDNRAYAVGLIVNGLQNIFERIDRRLGSDKKILKNLVNAACNHLSHSVFPESKGGTLLDMIEHFAGIDLERATYAAPYKTLYQLIKEFGLTGRDEVLFERTGVTPTNRPGRTL
ncbi:MAG: hypothetical protein KGI29_02550 [Pseudomonadota bacterium]|nr:hypothetical protein [Pseudomonadota bacterium]MDE3037518.1 hypothetical protein [Pseudomonadota bacterium]